MAILLERDEELHRLSTLLDDARRGRGRVAFVGGEAGVGKTALIAGLDASTLDARVVVGRCDALATPRTLGPFLDVSSALGLDPTIEREALLGQLYAHLQSTTTEVLVVIEDAHWADDASIELLAMLARRIGELRALLVVTYRHDEVTLDHPLSRVIGDLVSSSSTVWLGLRPLSLDAVAALAEAHRADVDVAALWRRTGGNPFYVTEALASPFDTVPMTVRLAVLARAARLPPAARAVLSSVAIVPGHAETWFVEALNHGPTDSIDECIGRCVDGGMLVATGDGVAFRHELARIAIEAEIEPKVRTELHRRAVAAILRQDTSDAARLAHHAAAAGDDAVLARAALEACRLAAARIAHPEAVRHGQRALTVSHELSPDDRADLKGTLVRSLVACARADAAVAFAHEAVEHWRAIGEVHREAGALVDLSTALTALGRNEESMRPVELAVRLLEHQPPSDELARAYLRLTSAHMLARDRDTAVRWGRRAIDLAQLLGDVGLHGRALIDTGIADVMGGRFDGLARVREGIDLGRRAGLPAVVALGLSQIGSGCGEMRRYDLAEPALLEGIDVASEHHLEGHRLYLVAWLARVRFDLGEWDAAEAAARDVLAGASSAVIARFVALNTLGWLRARRGDDDVWPLLDEALSIARVTNHLQRLWPVAVARAEAGWLEGALDEHVALLDETLALAVRCRHGVATGELGLWLGRAGRLTEPLPDALDCFASWTAGDHLAAATGLRRMGCPYEVASALTDDGSTGSLREALATYERLGAEPMADRVTAVLRSRGVRVSPSRRGRGGDRDADRGTGLSDRELEVLRLVAAGFTNPQIGAALFISRKTAEHHVSAILVKLGVASRTEAAAAAVRLGIDRGEPAGSE